MLHSISCRAAIKAGDHTSPQELMALAEKILSGEVPPFCPHGRPAFSNSPERSWKSSLAESCDKNQKHPVLAVVGPTATGKTALGVALAEAFEGEVISATRCRSIKG